MSKLTKALCAFDNQKDTKKTPLPKKSVNYAIVSKKGGGKTSLLLCLLTKKESPWYKFFNTIWLISPTAKRDDKMADLVKDLEEDGRYFTTLDNETLQHIMDSIDEYNEIYKQKKKKDKPCHLVIYDDCIHQMRGKKSRLMDELATQSRHRLVSNVYLIQKWNTYLPPLVRSNLDLISFFRTDNKKELDSFLEEMNGDEEMLRELYDYATNEPYSFLHINNYSSKPIYYKKFDEIKYIKDNKE